MLGTRLNETTSGMKNVRIMSGLLYRALGRCRGERRAEPNILQLRVEMRGGDFRACLC